eukprot:gene28694-35595_t
MGRLLQLELENFKKIKGQKDEAEFFRLKQNELADAKTEHVLWQLWRIMSEVEEHEAAVAAFQGDITALAQRESEVDDELRMSKAELARVGKSFTSAEKELQKQQRKLDIDSPKLTETQAKIKSVTKRIQELQRNENRVNQDLAKQMDSMGCLQGEMDACAEDELKLSAELNAAPDSGIKLGAAERAEYSRLREKVAAQTAADHASEMTLDAELKSKQQQLIRTEAQLVACQAEIKSGEKIIDENVDRAARLREAMCSNGSERAALEAEKNSFGEEATRSTEKLSTLRREAGELSERLRDAGNDKRRSKQEERVSEAISSLQNLRKGVYGKLVDLCRPIQKKYSKAIAVAAGKQMDAIVVDTRETAMECMKYLKEQRVGVCQFLPLDNISSAPVSDRLRSFGREFRPCIDLVECDDDRFRPAVMYAIGSTIVCDTLAQAQELCFTRKQSVKVVTINGHVINKSGAMTGGSSSSVHEGGGADRWEEKAVQKMRERSNQLSSEIVQLEQSAQSRQQLVDIESRLRSLQTKLQFNNADLAVSEQKLAQQRQQNALRETAAKAVAKEGDALRADIKRLEKQLTEFQRRTREVESSVFEDFSRRVGVANIRDYEEQGLRRHQDVLQRHAVASRQLAQLGAQMEYERKRDFRGVLDRVQTQLRDAGEEKGALEEQEQEMLQSELQLRGLVKSATAKLVVIKDEREAISSSIRAAHARRSELQSEREALAKKQATESNLIERGRAQLHDVLQKARVDEIALPTVDAPPRDIKRAPSAASSDSNSESDAVDETSSTTTDPLEWVGNRSQSEQFRSRASGGSGGKRDSRSTEDDEEEDGETNSTRVSSRDGSAHFSQVGDATVRKDARAAGKVDLTSMRKHKNLTKQKISEKEMQFARLIVDLVAELQTIQPNMHAAERYEGVLEKLSECTRELDEAKEVARDVVTRFDEVRKTRQNLYNNCFNKVSQSLGSIYSDLTRSSKHPLGGKAYLTLDNTDEPYQGGIRFTAMPPMKRFRDMEQLSGGEKTMAALALLFSIHSYRQAPFFVLDEVDAALDNVNVKKICNYIKQRSADFQCVVISLKDMFFEHAECLVGICKDVDSLSSQVLTLDLKQYENGRHEGSRSGTDEDDDDEDGPAPLSPAVSSISGSSANNTPLSQNRLSGGSHGKRGGGVRTSMVPAAGEEGDDEEGGGQRATSKGLLGKRSSAGSRKESREGGGGGGGSNVQGESILEEEEED